MHDAIVCIIHTPSFTFGLTHRQTDRQQAGKQTDRHTTHTQTDRQTHR